MSRWLTRVVPIIAGLAVSAAQATGAELKAPAAPPVIYNWTGFYVGAGVGYGMFNTDSSLTDRGIVASENVSNAGRGLFGTVGVGFDYQLTGRIVAGVFADWDFSDIKGHFGDPWLEASGAIKQNRAWAAGARIGYLLNPAVLPYFSGGFTQARFSGEALTVFGLGGAGRFTMQAQTYSGWFVGSGIEAMLPGLPGWSVKTEYRFSDYGSKDIPIVDTTNALPGIAVTVHPHVQTVRAELAYKFGWSRGAPGTAAMASAAVPAPHNWTGFYVDAGGGFGMFNADSSITRNGTVVSNNETIGGRGWFGTVGGGFDYQFAGQFVAGVLADWDISDIKGNWSDPFWEEGGPIKQKWAWSVGGRLGYLITPDLLAYLSGGFTQARFSDVHFFDFGIRSRPKADMLAAQTYSGWFIGAGAELVVPWFPGLSVRSEYRFADYGAKNVPILNQASVAFDHLHPIVQTVRTALVYRFNVNR